MFATNSHEDFTAEDAENAESFLSATKTDKENLDAD